MTSFTDVFGGSNIYSSDVSLLPLTLSADTTLEWPVSRSEGGTVAARIIEITTSGGSHTITLPDADKASKGETILFNNLGPASVDVVDAGGGAVATIPSGEVWQVYLSDNADADGTWRVFRYGVGSSSVQAASLVGYGIKAISSTLAQSNEVHTFNTTYTIGAPDRAALYVWTGGVDTLSLPAVASVGNDFFVSVRNGGSGNLTIDPSVSETINDASSLVMLPGDSAIIVTDGAEWFTVGLGQSADFAFDYTSINLAGLSGTYTLSGSELNRVSYNFTGALAGNIEVVVPATVQQYWVDNSTSGASYTLKIKTAAQVTPLTVTRGSRGIYYCNGTDVVKADTASIATPIGIADGGTGSGTAPGARTALGATSVGDAVFTAADEAAARTAILAAPLASPAFTGNPTAPTPSPGDNDTSIATTAFVAASYAPLASPALTGNPTAPTPSAGDNDTSIATTAFVAAALAAALPSGVIMLWSGSSGSIPTGWLLCDGTSGTPNLRDRFVVGAGSTYAVGATGGSANATLVSHSHTITITDPGHDHTANVTDPGHTHSLPGSTSSGGINETQIGVNSTAINATSASNTTGITVDNVANTTGITASSNTQGSSATNANLPPYYALCYIMKA